MNLANRGKVLFGLGGGGLHGCFAGLPVGGADLVGVALDVLNGLQHTLGFVNTTTESEVINSSVLNDSFEDR